MPLAGGYDANGNLLTALDSIMGQWNYTYDSLNRLTGAQAPVSQPTNISNYFIGIASGWTYDAFGNRKAEAQGAISGASPTAAMPASSSATYNTSNQLIAASQNAGGSLTYDASGNVVYDGINSYLYDAESRLCAVRNTAGGLTGYIYDAAGIRVAKGGLTAFTCNFATNGFAINTSWTLGPGGEQIGEFAVSGTTSTWTHSNAFAAGKLLATYNTTGTYFDFTDWLGTKRVEINAALSCETGFRSLPYGNGLTSYAPTAMPQCVDATEQHYTGKERDTESGNDYFEARYYASSFGRFMSPDWSAKEEPVPYAKLDNPQSLNLYGYVANNPTGRIDADGHCVEDLCIGEAMLAVAAVTAATHAVLAYMASPSGQEAIHATGQLLSMAAHGIGNALHSDKPTPEIVIDGKKHPESAQHAAEAQAAGHPAEVTIDRAKAKGNRAKALGGIPAVPGKHRDEYPPASTQEGGSGSSVRPISPADNSGSGASMGNQMRPYPDGTTVKITPINVPKPPTP